MAKRDVPTEPQLRCLLSIWLTGEGKIGSYDTPTMLAILKRGWIKPTGMTGTYPNGAEYQVHIVSDAGLDAIEEYLRARRYARQNAA